jgi:hypothetical protein
MGETTYRTWLEKRPLGRGRRRWNVNIKMTLRELGYEDGRWMELA